ncbi:MAG TPA: galactokinase family protein, partial [Longimicrobiales bacterium]|nr:galactokinase family protein [Longimicrobiales bacterium]
MTDPVAAFGERFGGPPSHVARAPGRVNLIGEHIDYNGLPVLPMALQRGVALAFRPRADGLVVLHTNAPGLAPLELEIRPGLEPYGGGHWGDYAQGVAHELARRFAAWRGLDGLVASDLPAGAGLASSSALVTALGLALAHINEVDLEQGAFAELMAEAERFTGTRGGVMDHAVSLGARSGCAVKISFAPLRLQHIPLPEGWRFVVADTGVRAQKSGPARKAYNLRRAECEEALSRVVDEVVRTGASRTTPTGHADLMRELGRDAALELGE